MSRSLRRYEILLPLGFDDGQAVPDDFVADTLLELEQRFGAVSTETQIKILPAMRSGGRGPAAGRGRPTGTASLDSPSRVMRPANQSRPSAIVVRQHSPERLIRALARGEVAPSCGCCCCCCCLHSAGGLAGAFVGSFYPSGSPDLRRKATPPVGLRDDELGGPTAAAPAGPGLLVPTIFWRTTAVLTLLGVIALSLGGGQVLALGVSMMVMGFPAVLLCASVVSALVLAARPSVRRDTRRWKQLGWITLGTVVGALIGWILMLPFVRN